VTVFLILVLLTVVAVGWLVLRDQVDAAESRLRSSSKKDRTALEREIAALATRVRILEQQLERIPATPVRVARQTDPESVAIPVLRASAPAPKPVDTAAPISVSTPHPEPEPLPHEPEVAFAVPDFAAAPLRPAWFARLREWLSHSEWEALVGGSLLNKLGALILVIGIALFLGYSFRMMHPAGTSSAALRRSVTQCVPLMIGL
jgi:uncharacterized membrane protein